MEGYPLEVCGPSGPGLTLVPPTPPPPTTTLTTVLAGNSSLLGGQKGMRDRAFLWNLKDVTSWYSLGTGATERPQGEIGETKAPLRQALDLGQNPAQKAIKRVLNPSQQMQISHKGEQELPVARKTRSLTNKHFGLSRAAPL